MSHPRQPSTKHSVALGLACVALLGAQGHALAQSNGVAEAAPKVRTMTVVLDSSTGEIDIPVHPDMFTSIKLPSDITYALGVDRIEGRFYIRRRGDTLTVKPRHGWREGPTSFRLESATVTVTARMHSVDNEDDVANLVYQVFPKPEAAVCEKAVAPVLERAREKDRQVYQEELAAALTSTRTEEQTRCEVRVKENEDRARLAQRQAVARSLVDEYTAREGNARLVPVVEHEPDSPVEFKPLVAHWEESELMIPFRIRNRSNRPVYIDGLQVHGPDGQILESEMVYRGDREPEMGEVLAVVPKDSTVIGVIGLPRASEHTIEQLRFTLQAKGMDVISARIKTWGLRPISDAELDREDRARMTTVSVRGLYGAFWTDAGDDLGGLDDTSVAGFGARLTKGIFHNLAFEGEFVGGRTGDATFAGVDWGGMQGDVTRRASLGRLQALGVIRFGDQYVISTRAGLGIQLANYDSTFDVGGNVMDGPGDGLEVDGVWTVGGGFDARLGENWSLGAGLTFGAAIKTDVRSLEAGLHLGYSWGKRPSDD